MPRNYLREKVVGRTMKGEKSTVFTIPWGVSLSAMKKARKHNDRSIASSSKAVESANRFRGKAKFPKKAMFFGFLGALFLPLILTVFQP